MKKQVKKLVLAKETVRSLDLVTLNGVAGGSYEDTSCYWRLCFETDYTVPC